nr:glycoside hydrolase family 3 C-terminal domain-containing protein [uncultured Albidiferax sp.]
MKRMLSVFWTSLVATTSLVVSVSCWAEVDPPYKNSKLDVEVRIVDLLGRMTLEEKASLLSGVDWMDTRAIDRLGIPSLKTVDGPLGVRAWMASSAETNAANSQFDVSGTAFPSGISMAASWNPALVERVGQAIAKEAKALGRDMLLGPTVDINRQPLWGRNFESFGEDPFLSGKIAVGFVRGVQDKEGLIATVKHFAANNSEWERRRIDEKIDERTLHEIYLPPYKAAIQDGGAWAVMTAYNKVNGKHSSENSPLLDDILRKQWKFKGLTISDWGSTYSTAAPINAGLDLEMPGGARGVTFLTSPRAAPDNVSGMHMTTEKVLSEVKEGKISPATLDARVSNLLRVLLANGLFENQHVPGGNIDTAQQRNVAFQAALESIVLLKNDKNLLPLSPARLRSIAVIGPNAATARTGGGGSSLVRPKMSISPLLGIQERAGSGVRVDYALGVSMQGENPQDDGTESRAKQLKSAVDLAAKADVAILVVGRYDKIESEAFDQDTMDLPPGQNELIEAVTKVNPRTIVVLNTGNPVTMKWLDKVPALLDIWYGGQEGGRALAEILFGDANPSGKLPVSFPYSWEDTPVYGNYPGDRNRTTTYSEGIYVGYRYYDKRNVRPLFPFGFGLSYSKFEYSKIKIENVKDATGNPDFHVNVTIRNTGKRAGAEIVQLYVHDDHAKVERPIRELKGFQRLALNPGEAKQVNFTLTRQDLSYYSPQASAWVADPGMFQVQIGASSRDIRLRSDLLLEK